MAAVVLPVSGGGSGVNGPGSLGALIVRQKQCSVMMIFSPFLEGKFDAYIL